MRLSLADMTRRKRRPVSMIPQIVAAAEAQARRARQPRWGCKGANGSLYYVDHFERKEEYCLLCAPLLAHPHRCFWDGDNRKKTTKRYLDARMLPVYAEAEKMYARTLPELLEALKGHQEKTPYVPGSGKLKEYRRQWKRGEGLAIEYYVLGDVPHLNLTCDTRDITPEEIVQVRSAARGVFHAEMVLSKMEGKNPVTRGDDKRIIRFELRKAEQGAMVLA